MQLLLLGQYLWILDMQIPPEFCTTDPRRAVDFDKEFPSPKMVFVTALTQ